MVCHHTDHCYVIGRTTNSLIILAVAYDRVGTIWTELSQLLELLKNGSFLSPVGHKLFNDNVNW
jgi:hypothetical protein